MITITGAAEIPADLVWSDDRAPGIRRNRAGRSFRYRTDRGAVSDAATIARVKRLAIPPAWTDVWICADPSGHLQATGRDAKGRKQYRYHERYREHRDALKFEHLYDFSGALPAIRKQVEIDLARPGMPKEKVVATIVRLLEETLVRVGNEEYARENGSYGLTTLRNRHVRVNDVAVRFQFTAKHGTAADVTVRDRRLRRIVKQCQDLPGQVLFQHLEADGSPHPISSSDVNDYLRDVSGLPVTAKEFRTWMATVLAAADLAALDPPASDRAARRDVVRVCRDVSTRLANTAAVCRASYVHPQIVEWYRDGSLGRRWQSASARGSRLLDENERRLRAMLRPPRRRDRRREPARLAA